MTQERNKSERSSFSDKSFSERKRHKNNFLNSEIKLEENKEDKLMKKINFDAEYYRSRYFIHNLKNDNEAINHWEREGYYKGYLTSICDELKTHNHCLCNCKIRNNIQPMKKRDISIKSNPKRSKQEDKDHPMYDLSKITSMTAIYELKNEVKNIANTLNELKQSKNESIYIKLMELDKKVDSILFQKLDDVTKPSQSPDTSKNSQEVPSNQAQVMAESIIKEALAEKEEEITKPLPEVAIENKSNKTTSSELPVISKITIHCLIEINEYLKKCINIIMKMSIPGTCNLAYDAGRNTIMTHIKEIDKIILNTKYHKINLFQHHKPALPPAPSKKNDNIINYKPHILDCIKNTDSINKAPQNQNNEKLMPTPIIDLMILNLDNYTMYPLTEDQIMTYDTNPLPPSGFDQVPPYYNKLTYDLKRNWDPRKHIGKFESAIYRINLEIERIKNDTSFQKLF